MFKKSILTLSIMLGIAKNFKNHNDVVNDVVNDDNISPNINEYGFTVNIDDLIGNRPISKSTRVIK